MSVTISPHVSQASLNLCLHLAICPCSSAVHLCFISDTPVEFKSSKLQRPGIMLFHTGPLGEGLTTLGLAMVCAKKAVAPTRRSFEFKVQQKAWVRVSCPQQMSLLLYLGGGGVQWCLLSLSSLESQYHLSQMYSKKGEPSLTVCSRWSQYCAVHSQASALLPRTLQSLDAVKITFAVFKLYYFSTSHS